MNNLQNKSTIINAPLACSALTREIIPLFRTPLTLKNINNSLTPQNGKTATINTNLNKLSLNNILDLYLKAFTLYNNNFNNYLNSYNNLDLILEKKNVNNLNLKISNYFYILNRIFLQFQLNSLLYNINLFIPTQILHSYSNIKYINNINNITKIINNTSLNSEELNYLKIEINELINQGNELINELDYQITLKKNIITKIKNNNVNATINNLLPTPAPKGGGNYTSAFPTGPALNEGDSSSLITLKAFEQNLAYNKLLKSINKSNEIKIEQTIKSILKNKDFDYKTDSISINSNPVSVEYYGNSPIINKYLKSMSIYSMRTAKGGIFIYYSNIIGYYFNSNINKLIKNAYSLITASFKSMYALISKPVFIITSDKIIIQLFYYLFIPNILKLKKIYKYGYRQRNKLNNFTLVKGALLKRKSNIKKLYRKFRKLNVNVRINLRKLSNTTLINVYPKRFEKLCEILSNFFKKPVELDLIRLHYPYNDSTILVNLLGIMINKIKLRIIIRKLFEKAVIKNLNKINTLNNKNNIIPAFLSGITIKVAGRLLTHKVVPRQTIKITRRGALAKGKINFSDVARFTNKNKRGAFSITISSGQNYF